MSGVTKMDLKRNNSKIEKEWTAPVLKKISIEEITASHLTGPNPDHGNNAMS